MDLEKSLLSISGLADIKLIATYCSGNKKRFAALMKLFLSEKDKVAQRAAWAVSHAFEMNNDIIKPYINLLVEQLQKSNIHDALIRNSVRILQSVEIPEELEGEVMNSCFNFIEKHEVAPAIKAFSLTTLFNLSKKYPEIKPELKIIIEEKWDTEESAAFKSRAGKILKKL